MGSMPTAWRKGGRIGNTRWTRLRTAGCHGPFTSPTTRLVLLVGPGSFPDPADRKGGMGMSKKERESSVDRKRSREELAMHFMRLRLEDAERRAQAYQATLDPRQQA